MVSVIQGKTINELVFNCLDKIIVNGNRTGSRNGDVNSLNNVFAELENPRSRHLGLVGRNNNIFATIAETFWVLAGDDKIDPFLSFYLPRAKDYSDDGKTWRGAYGPRLFKYNQLDDVIQQFRNEGIFTRRAVLYIGTPELDTQESLDRVYNLENTKDRPCNTMCDFFVTPDLKLHMNVKSRSGDVIWGFGSINIFEWTVLHEFILQELKREVNPNLTMGSYNHLVSNLHLYDFNGAQGYTVLENRLKQKLGLQNYKKLYFPHTSSKLKDFCSALLRIWSTAIEFKSNNIQELNQQITLAFDIYKVPVDDNLLFKYAELVSAYTIAKINKEDSNILDSIMVDMSNEDAEFKFSIESSTFRKFKILEKLKV